MATNRTKLACSQLAMVSASCKIDAFGSLSVLTATLTFVTFSLSFPGGGFQVPRCTVPYAPVPSSKSSGIFYSTLLLDYIFFDTDHTNLNNLPECSSSSLS